MLHLPSPKPLLRLVHILGASYRRATAPAACAASALSASATRRAHPDSWSRKAEQALPLLQRRDVPEPLLGSDAANLRAVATCPAAEQDIQATLAVRRWSFFGLFRFGPRQQVGAIRLFADASADTFVGTVELGGRPVRLGGALLARVAAHQSKALPARAPSWSASARYAPPKPAPNAPTLRCRKSARDAFAAAVRQSLAESVALMQTENDADDEARAIAQVDAMLAAEPREAAAAGSSEAARAWDPDTVALWQTYCDGMAKPSTYATYVEAIALTRSHGYRFDIVVADGTPGAREYNRLGGIEPPPGVPVSRTLTLLLTELPGGEAHYEPLEMDLEAAGPLTEASIAPHVRHVPGDGSCFFHSVAYLTGRPAATLRAEAVAWLRANGFAEDHSIAANVLSDPDDASVAPTLRAGRLG